MGVNIIKSSQRRFLAVRIIALCNIMLYCSIEGRYLVTGSHYNLHNDKGVQRDPSDKVVTNHSLLLDYIQKIKNTSSDSFEMKTNRIHKIKDLIFNKLEHNEKLYYLNELLDFVQYSKSDKITNVTLSKNRNDVTGCEKLHDLKNKEKRRRKFDCIFQYLEDRDTRYVLQKVLHNGRQKDISYFLKEMGTRSPPL